MDDQREALSGVLHGSAASACSASVQRSIDVAPDSWGSLAGQVFVAEWGDLAPNTNPLRNPPAGFQISRIDENGDAVPFVHNALPGPASRQDAKGKGIERPFDVKFGPDGAMYIVDYGVANVNLARIRENQVPYEFLPETGAIWKVTFDDLPDSSTLDAATRDGDPPVAPVAFAALAALIALLTVTGYQRRLIHVRRARKAHSRS